MRRIIKLDVDARNALASGAKKLTDAVSSTLGPFGKTFFLDKKNSITNDGVTVAKEFQLQDEVENRGVTAFRESAIKTVEQVGDGTTTAITLAYPIYESARTQLADKDTIGGKKTGAEVIAQIEKERQEITQKLIDSAIQIDSEDALIASAKVSTGDETLGNLIGKAQWALGKDGFLIVEDTIDSESSVEMVKGIRLDNGLVSSRFVTNPEKHSLEVDNVKIILTSFTIRSWEEQLVPILTQLGKAGASSVIVLARAFTEEATQAFGKNLEKGGMPVFPVNAPYTDMSEVMKDLAALTGAKYYDSEGTDLKDMQLSDVGFIRRIAVERFTTVVTGLDDDQSKIRIQARIDELNQKLLGQRSEFEKKLLLGRIAQLQNGFGIVKVGSPSQMERQRLLDKAEDGVNAVRAAYQEGTIKGAGLALKEISDSLPDTYLLKRPICAPYNQIMNTAPAGFVIEDWVRDPLKVIRIALENACTMAASFANVGGVITAEITKSLDEMFRKGVNNPQAGLDG